MNARSDKTRETRKQPAPQAAARISGAAPAPLQSAGARADQARLREWRELAAASPPSARQRSIRQLSVHGAPQAKQAAQLEALVGRSPQMNAFVQTEQGRRAAGFDPGATGMAREADHARPGIVQMKMDAGKFNVVSEDHSRYDKVRRDAEAQKVSAIFGQGTYHVEDSFSAIPNLAQTGKNDEEKDILQSFSSKADPPYYAITQGLQFIVEWCGAYDDFQKHRWLLVLINAAQVRIETEMVHEPLKKVEGSAQEEDFVLTHDILRDRFDSIDEIDLSKVDPTADLQSEQVELVQRYAELNAEVRTRVAKLKLAAKAYLAKIQIEYAKARTEFERSVGIKNDDDLIKKRSVMMARHAGLHAELGNKGVLKVGAYHLSDFESMDLKGATLSDDDELQKFIQANTPAQDTGQLKSAGRAAAGGAPAGRSAMPSKASPTGLPVELKSGIEALSGHSMGEVEVHYNSAEPARFNARAFAQGKDIHLAPGQERHLPHEAWHVVQQSQGRVRPTARTMGGVAINDDAALEREADAMGRKAMQFRRSVDQSLAQASAPSAAARAPANHRQPMQRLSDILTDDWVEQFGSREELRQFPPFHAIAALIEKKAGKLELEAAIRKFGEMMLGNDADIGGVYKAIARYFPESYLTIEDVRKVKTYNFNGPITFTAENAKGWLRLAAGEGTVEDLRYIHHEIYEIKQIEKNEGGSQVIKDTDPGESFDDLYDAAHFAALMVEIRFLTHAVNLIFKKAYEWQHVAASDLERREDFLTALYGNDGLDLPLDKKHFPDMNQVAKDYGKYIDPELGILLAELKGQRL